MPSSRAKSRATLRLPERTIPASVSVSNRTSASRRNGCVRRTSTCPSNWAPRSTFHATKRYCGGAGPGGPAQTWRSAPRKSPISDLVRPQDFHLPLKLGAAFHVPRHEAVLRGSGSWRTRADLEVRPTEIADFRSGASAGLPPAPQTGRRVPRSTPRSGTAGERVLEDPRRPGGPPHGNRRFREYPARGGYPAPARGTDPAPTTRRCSGRRPAPAGAERCARERFRTGLGFRRSALLRL